MCLSIASVSNESPQTLRSFHRETESLTEETMGKAHACYTHTHHMDGYGAGYLREGACVCV